MGDRKIDDAQVLEGILPWTRSCFVCGQDNPHGLHLKSRLENGVVKISYTPRAEDLGYSSIVHGGITMTLLDEVMTWAAIIASGQPCVAAVLSCRLKKPVVAGVPIVVEGRTEESRLRLILTEGTVRAASDGSALATADGKYVPMKTDDASVVSKDFVGDSGAIDLSRILNNFRPGRPCREKHRHP